MDKTNMALKTSASAAALALALASAGTVAGDNPFGAIRLESGYQLASHHEGAEGKAKEAHCGEGKCGGEASASESKSGEGKCGGEVKGKEGKSGEGKCGGAA